mmetsp:Transcript_30103/g.55016  ORF Transcript_30103/g.55016 Transcript_30103/m.55016 type:complete len:218 (-) Transcript_30103:233-886(-)|eukprot:CAMPEP_0175057798 /NCGR_PEP_ID=MMETSP0052_2-20121109/11467_1 /TAXON_ID=51329 ORGANISM="Polytomella parva, Strain SAG 63-3" /NCGR_SAMPLE_ID=MMETSP0052_2 /ASSEMBLY_ACC=CAM_ASM_000194 /LENGTH=217 /DNA_ID=CAMNT_0016323057 /DNA_START=89 /DNA_END=742 /DNA_ORIENTATION=+
MSHPYVPEDIVLPGFTNAKFSRDEILAYFGASTALVFIFMWSISGKFKYLSTIERLWCCWFLISGLIHIIVEGTVVTSNKFYQDATGNFLKDVWKEYSKADSRYATRDAFIIQMEGFTAFVEGPVCLLIVYSLLYRKAYRYTLMLLVSCGQLYGDILYYLTCVHEGLRHSRREPLYFYGYFIGANAIWIVIPSLCIYYAARNINTIMTAAQSKGKSE